MTDTDRIAELEATVKALNERLTVMERRPEPMATDGPVSRRAALRTAGVLAAGAIAGGIGAVTAATPAAAAAYTGSISATATPTEPGVSAVADLQPAISATSASDAPAIVVTRTTDGSAMTVDQFGNASAYGIGITTSGSDYGMRATGRIGAQFEGDVGAFGVGRYNTGVATLSGVGVAATGQTSALYLWGPDSRPPSLRAPLGLQYGRGMIDVDLNGDVWHCIASGNPGVWRKISGPTSAGAFHAIGPSRVYDSRRSVYSNHGPMASGTNRTVSVADAHDASTGVVSTSDIVPSGATAVAANVTVVNTVGVNNFCINPGGDTSHPASTINWYATGQTLANGVVLSLNAARELTIVAGAQGGSADVILDVTGFWL